MTGGIFKTGDNVYFVSPTLIGPDGTGASQPGTEPFAGQVFFNPSAGTVGNLQRRMFSGPWQWSSDISVNKTIAFTERHTLDLHLDVFNWANHTTFGQIDTMNYNPRVLQIGAYYRLSAVIALQGGTLRQSIARGSRPSPAERRRC